MAWKLELAPKAARQLNKLGKPESKRILAYLHERLLARENPRELGKALAGNLREAWCYRVGNYRVICRIEDAVLTVFVVEIDHRSAVYKQR